MYDFDDRVHHHQIICFLAMVQCVKKVQIVRSSWLYRAMFFIHIPFYKVHRVTKICVLLPYDLLVFFDLYQMEIDFSLQDIYIYMYVTKLTSHIHDIINMKPRATIALHTYYLNVSLHYQE